MEKDKNANKESLPEQNNNEAQEISIRINNDADKEVLFEQYKLYCQMKEGFVDRNFMTNKFYLCVVIAIFVIMFFTRNITFDYNISANLIMSILGMAVAFFWWSNADAYNIMIKVKLKNVIDEMEKVLPMSAHLIEMKGFSRYKKQNKVVIFSDMQKGVAISMILIFFILFLLEVGYPLMTMFYGPLEGYSRSAGL